MVPTPPDAPLTRTRLPAPTCPTSRMAISAVRPVMTDAAAQVKLTAAGFLTTWDPGATAYSAKVPGRVLAVLPQSDPNTSSPGRWSVTCGPTAATTPATALP